MVWNTSLVAVAESDPMTKQVLLVLVCCVLVAYGTFAVGTALEDGFWGSWLRAGLATILGLAGFARVAGIQARQRGWSHLPPWLLLLGGLAVLSAVLIGAFDYVCGPPGFSCGG